MSTYEQRDNSGSLFGNNRKTQDNHPDRTGKAMIGGVMYWVNAWEKTTRDGKQWFSLSFKEITDEQHKPQQTPQPKQEQKPYDYNPDACPF